MSGLSDYTAKNLLNWLTGGVAQPSLPSVWLALFTAVGTDAGSGFTEVSGGSYARVQVAGTQATNGTTASGNPTLHFASTPSWIVAGMEIYNSTTPSSISAATTVLSVTGTTVTMSANAAGAGVGSGDTIIFTAFSTATGTGPSTITNNSAITLPASTANWGTVIAFGLYDASSSGNLLLWDFLGNYPWIPFESTNVGSGNGPVFSVKANAYSNTDPVVLTAEYGGTLPTLTAGTITAYTPNFVANQATDSLTLQQTSGGSAITSSSTGSGMMRKITQQSIPSGITASFAASALTATAA